MTIQLSARQCLALPGVTRRDRRSHGHDRRRHRRGDRATQSRRTSDRRHRFVVHGGRRTGPDRTMGRGALGHRRRRGAVGGRLRRSSGCLHRHRYPGPRSEHDRPRSRRHRRRRLTRGPPSGLVGVSFGITLDPDRYLDELTANDATIAEDERDRIPPLTVTADDKGRVTALVVDATSTASADQSAHRDRYVITATYDVAPSRYLRRRNDAPPASPPSAIPHPLTPADSDPEGYVGRSGQRQRRPPALRNTSGSGACQPVPLRRECLRDTRRSSATPDGDSTTASLRSQSGQPAPRRPGLPGSPLTGDDLALNGDGEIALLTSARSRPMLRSNPAIAPRRTA